jgi:hypothetical protein
MYLCKGANNRYDIELRILFYLILNKCGEDLSGIRDVLYRVHFAKGILNLPLWVRRPELSPSYCTALPEPKSQSESKSNNVQFVRRASSEDTIC